MEGPVMTWIWAQVLMVAKHWAIRLSSLAIFYIGCNNTAIHFPQLSQNNLELPAASTTLSSFPVAGSTSGNAETQALTVGATTNRERDAKSARITKISQRYVLLILLLALEMRKWTIISFILFSECCLIAKQAVFVNNIQVGMIDKVINTSWDMWCNIIAKICNRWNQLEVGTANDEKRTPFL